MRAAYYEKLGPAKDVLKVGEAPKPVPQAGEVLVRVQASGVNPSDVKMRLGTSSATNEYPRIIPHSDGAVGHYAVQMAKLKGAKVIATVSSDAKAARAKAAGADAVVNYKSDDLVARVKDLTGGKGVDRVIEVDLAANIAKLPALVADYGMIVVYGSGARDVPVSFGASILGNIGYRFFIVYNQPPELRCRGTNAVNEWLRQGRLTHSVAARFSLGEIVTAHEAVESGKVDGHVIVTLD
jgi:NADPH2:quinone reductase